ncbi:MULTISPECIES: hypothetical protein [Paenibacillus]|uniref:hypothetical protein n=1 Tax=Paenibacillus TaxID=44249 RepID=UPI0022B88F57|nr:hypothetical protein [Paenibacillus caseinilyticus]MCZ8518746.1 hypothetical protein [Paenibacillus caseinilyticus]
MNLQDALFNWLQISLVAAARPDDNAAAETRDFFEVILREDHGLQSFSYALDRERYRIDYIAQGEPGLQRFDAELAGGLLTDINSNPKYND